MRRANWITCLAACAALNVLAAALVADDVEAEDQPRVMVVGHRAGGFFAPENTLAAIDLAAEVGLDGVELDVRKTADGHFVLLHDDTVDRTTNGSGKLSEMTLAEVRDLEITWTPQPFIEPAQFPVPPDDERFAHLTVPTLDEALDQALGKLFIALDLKRGDAEEVARLVAEKDMLDDVIFKVNSIAEAQTVQDAAPDAILMARPKGEEEFDEMMAAFAPPIVHLDKDTFTPEIVERVHDADALVWINALGRLDVRMLLSDGRARSLIERLDSDLAGLLGSAFRTREKGYEKLADSGADIIQTDNIVRVVETMSEYRKP